MRPSFGFSACEADNPTFFPASLYGYARNPTLDKSDIEKYLRDYLGVELVLWLGQGVVGDVDTDGHIDNLVAFVRPGEVSSQQDWKLGSPFAQICERKIAYTSIYLRACLCTRALCLTVPLYNVNVAEPYVHLYNIMKDKRFARASGTERSNIYLRIRDSVSQTYARRALCMMSRRECSKPFCFSVVLKMFPSDAGQARSLSAETAALVGSLERNVTINAITNSLARVVPCVVMLCCAEGSATLDGRCRGSAIRCIFRCSPEA